MMGRTPAPELEYDDDLARGLRRARLSSGIGVREAAKLLKLAPSSVVRIEGGESIPSLETIERMAVLYQANLNVGPDGVMVSWLGVQP